VALMADIVDIDTKRPRPEPESEPTAPQRPVSEDEFEIICHGLRSLPSEVKIAAIVRACTDSEFGSLAALSAHRLGSKVLDHVQFGLEMWRYYE
jgi:hypothetical protein